MKPYFQEQKKRNCLFCTDKKEGTDYKEVSLLRTFLSDRGKITPRRISGNCALHQRQVTRSIKRSRNIAMMAFTEER
ncbi:MAG: 30S ribosomal protein S18 [Nitrospirota bacterium]